MNDPSNSVQRTLLLPLLTRRAAVIAGFVIVFLSEATWAEHEADHRYILEGYVLTGQEAPRSDVEVAVRAGDRMLGRTRTDRQGHYRIQLHLHNTDLGKRLTVTAAGQKADIEVAFDPADRETKRVHELSFVGTRTTDADLGWRGVPTWWYVVAGAVAVAVAARSLSTVRRKRRKALAKQQSADKKPGRKKSGRTRRK
jgi:hypothetical protein